MRTQRAKTIVTMTPRPKPVLPDGSVTITMNISQAEALMLVCAKVSGSPTKSRRGLIQDIYEGLEDAGIDYENGKEDCSGNIYFKDIVQ